MIIALDIGNVIATFDKRNINDFLKSMGVLEQDFYDDDFINFQKGVLSSREFLKKKSTLLRCFENELFVIFKDMIQKAPSTLLEKVPYPYCFLSNINEIHFQRLKEQIIISDFALKYSTLSYNVGCLKPDIKFFVHFLEQGFPAASIIYIDDHLENLKAAKGLGIHGIHCPHAEALAQIIKRL